MKITMRVIVGSGMSRPTVPEVLPLVRAIYNRPDGSGVTGCCLHILTDDGNTGVDTAQFCFDYAREQGHVDCIAAAEMLVLMTETQHHKVYWLRLAYFNNTWQGI